jgi:opacity protein-like surface antigen
MKKIAIATLLSAFVAAPAVAADSVFYAGVKLGQANYGGTITNNNQGAYGFLLGLPLNETIAIEAEYISLGGFDFPTRTYKGSALGVSAVGTFPLNQKFSLLVKLGIEKSSLKATLKPGYIAGYSLSSDRTGLASGLGGQYNASPVFAIRAGIDFYPVGDSTIGTTNARVLNVSGVFKF